MSVWVVRFVWEIVLVHDLPADEGLKRQRGEHVQTEEETCDVHHHVVVWEVVEHIAECLVAKGQVSRECHDETRYQGYTGAVMGDAREAIDGRLSQRSVDEETVVVADEREGYHTYGFEYT